MNTDAEGTPIKGTPIKGEVTKRSVGRKTLFLDPHEIVIDHGANGRFDPELTYVDDLIFGVKSLAVIGQIQPIEVVKEPGLGEKRYRVQVGYRRVMAARKINELNPNRPKFFIEAIEVMPRNGEDAFARNVSENFNRKSLTPMDLAFQMRKWIEVYRKDKNWCAEFYDKSYSWVEGHLLLLRLETAIQRRIHNREIGWQAGRELTTDMSPEEAQLVLDILGERGENATAANIVKTKRELGSLTRQRKRSKKEAIEALEMISGSPDCPPKAREWFDLFVEFLNGEHDVDKLASKAWRLA